jgi:ABC-2 type transport system ATP-binding protein
MIMKYSDAFVKSRRLESMAEETMVSVRGLVKRYGAHTAVDSIDFEVYRGEVFGLLGPNGAGKTTTLECLEGLRQFDAGFVSVAGCDPRRDEKRLRKVLGVQLQSSSLPEAMLVSEAMDLICAWHGIPARKDLLVRFGLEEMLRTQYVKLSTGLKRRLHLSLALATDPEVVVLDEPTAGLDVQGRAQLHEAIRELKANGVTLLLATHDMAEAQSLCDRIAIIIRGRLVALGTPEQITAAGDADTRITLRTRSGSLLPGVSHSPARFVRTNGEYGVWQAKDVVGALTILLGLIQANGDEVEDLRVERPSLEERFLEIIEGGAVK